MPAEPADHSRSAEKVEPLIRLLPHHLHDLQCSGLNAETIERWGCYSIEADQPWVMSQLGFPHLAPPALALPVLPLDLAAPDRNFCVLKPDSPRPDSSGRPVKYESRKNFANRLHVPLSIRRRISEPSETLIITEGQKKAEAAGQRDICAVALFGVNNWLSRVGESSFPIGDFHSIHLKDRRVILCFDSDAAQNAQVRRAERDLARFLSKLGAKVFIKRLPPGLDGQKVGLDDFLLKNSPEQFRALPEEAPELEPSIESLIEELTSGSPGKFRQQIFDGIAREEDSMERARLLRRMAKRLEVPFIDLKNRFKPVLDARRRTTKAAESRDSSQPNDSDGPAPVDPGDYRIQNGYICVERMKEYGAVKIPLCNFTAKIVEQIVLDDGAESARALDVEGQLSSGEILQRVRVPADRFAGMGWVIEQWGPGPIVNAGPAVKDQLREAIQRLSSKPPTRRVFRHTGWRDVGGKWVFLHAGGAVGCDGLEVDIGPDLQSYRLPSRPENVLEAVRLSLALLKVAPLPVTVGLWAAMYRSPLASLLPVDFSLWLVGPTGALKSTLAALFLSHFGDFTSLNLPGSWSSTANQLERRAFTLQDLPFVVDDFLRSSLDGYELDVKAAQLLRSQGNLSGRGRLRADLTERRTFVPRGLTISTGEEHPFPGSGSLLARTLFLELERSIVDLAALTRAQRAAHRLPHAMSAYIAWLIPQLGQLPDALRKAIGEARNIFTIGHEHLRRPQALANLWIGANCALSFAEDLEALSASEREVYRDKLSEALMALGQAQTHFLEAERPVVRFARLLFAVLAQHLITLVHRDSLGTGAMGEQTFGGWFDDHSLLLLPEPVYRAVARFAREAGEPFPLRQGSLLRDLGGAGLSACDNGRTTANKRIGGKQWRVVELALDALQRVSGEDFLSVLPRSRPLAEAGHEL